MEVEAAETSEGIQTRTLVGSLTISGEMKVGEVITANLAGAPEGVTVKYSFFYAGANDSLQFGTSNKYFIDEEDVGEKIVVRALAEGYDSVIVICDEVKKADVASYTLSTPTPVTYNGKKQLPSGTVNITSGASVTITDGKAEGYEINVKHDPDLEQYTDAGKYFLDLTPATGTTGSAIRVNYIIEPITVTEENVNKYFIIGDYNLAGPIWGGGFESVKGPNDNFVNKFRVGDGDLVNSIPKAATFDVYVSIYGTGNYKADGEGNFKVGTVRFVGSGLTISGTMKAGEEITVTIEDAVDIGDKNVIYNFFRAGSSDGSTLQRGPSNKYILQDSDVGHQIVVSASADGGGYRWIEAITEGVVEKADPLPPSGGNGFTGTVTPSNPSTGTTTTETKPDGTKVETATETKPDGTKVETVTETKPDGSVTETVKESDKNSSGKEVAVTTTTEKDAGGKVTSEIKTSVIANADTDTSVIVTAKKDSAGTVTADAAVTKAGTAAASGKTKGTISSSVVKQIVEAAGTSDVAIAQTVTKADGSKKFTVTVNAKDLVSGEALKIMKLDPKTGDYVLCNAKDYNVSAAGGVALSIKTDGDFILVNEADAKAASDAILKTVKVKDSKKTLSKGKSTKMALDSGLNMKNVSKITYTVSKKSVATVDKNGKVVAKKSGTVTVNAKVRLKNGKTKTVKMTINIK